MSSLALPPAQSPDTPLAPHSRGWFRTGLQILAGITCALLLLAIIIPLRHGSSTPARRTVDLSHIRQIGQAALIYAQDHHDQFPEAADVWDYARLLAPIGISDPVFWISREDPANWSVEPVENIILPSQTTDTVPLLNPAFRRIKPAVAVVLGKISANIPATTPLVWTRGLQPDGTWAKHSPCGGDGGFIYFAGGNMSFFRELTSDDGGELVRFDGKGKTANILEALPPATRIGEYKPTPEEVASWPERPRYAHTPRTRWLKSHQPELVVSCTLTAFIALCIYVYRRKKSSPGVMAFLIVFGTGLALLMVA